jgi:hypothetical protein
MGGGGPLKNIQVYYEGTSKNVVNISPDCPFKRGLGLQALYVRGRESRNVVS